MSTVLLQTEEGVARITLNRPDVFNAFDDEQSYALQAALKEASRNDEVRVVVLTGAGKAFCSGQDLKSIKDSKDRDLSESLHKRYNPIIRAMREMPKPIIAAVNGIAFGGGLETTLACDLAVADPTAQFGLTEVKVGVIAGAGGAVRLPRQIPRKIAVELLLTGRHMDVAEAREWGLINRVSEPGKVMEEARKLAAEIIAASPTSVRLTMQLIHEGEDTASPDAAANAMLHSLALDSLMISDDMVEGMTAFAQKRAPQWRNR